MAGGALLPSILTHCSPADPGPEVKYAGSVAVIGAGAAGLYVADILRSKGIKVTIYEAGPQIGGRIKSLRNQPLDQYPIVPDMGSDFPLELGADTYVGTDSILGKIAQVYNLATTEFPPSNSVYVLDSMAKSAGEWASDPDFNAAINFRQNLGTHVGSAQSVQQAIQAAGVGSRAYGMLNAQIGNVYGADNDLAGIGEIAEEETLRTGDGKILILTGNPLQELLISRFNGVVPMVKLNTPITSIQYGSDPIVLTSKDGGSFEANKVIVTVPVSILKGGGISFSPGLTGAHTGSLAKIGMGASFRALIEFKKNFWGDTIGYILGSANVPEFMSVGLSRSSFNATLQVTVNGTKGAQLSSMGAAALDTILADLDVLYAGQATQFIRKTVDKDTLLEKDPIYILEDWTTREYILGGYSYPLPGATNDDRSNIGKPINDKLFFAGEATDVSGNAGMINGALASAERCAEEVVKSITGAS